MYLCVCLCDPIKRGPWLIWIEWPLKAPAVDWTCLPNWLLLQPLHLFALLLLLQPLHLFALLLLLQSLCCVNLICDSLVNWIVAQSLSVAFFLSSCTTVLSAVVVPAHVRSYLTFRRSTNGSPKVFRLIVTAENVRPRIILCWQSSPHSSLPLFPFLSID